MYLKNLLSTIALSLIAVSPLLSQNAPLKNWEETTRAVSEGNQASNMTSGDVSSINQSGDVSASVPVIEIKSRNMSIPISANYSAGIKVDQKASSIGLGWNWSFGSIQRDYGAFEPDYTATSPEAYMIDEDGPFNGRIDDALPTSNNRSLIYNGLQDGQIIPDEYHVSAPGLGGNTFWNNGAVNQPHEFVFSNQTTWKVEHTVKDYSVSQEFSRINEYNLGGVSTGIQTDQNGDKYLVGNNSYAAAIGLLPYVKNQYFESFVVDNAGQTNVFNPGAQERKVEYEDFGGFTITSGDGTIYVFDRPLRGQKYMMNEDPYWSTIGGNVPVPFDGDLTEHWKMDYIAEWLLTKILSPDYRDLNGNGIPDQGDAGDWIYIEYTAPTKLEDVMLGQGSSIEVPMHREWTNLSQTDRASSLMRERAYVRRITTPIQEIDFTVSERFDVDCDYYSKPANYVNNRDYIYADLKYLSSGSSSDFDIIYPVETMRYDTIVVKETRQDERFYPHDNVLSTIVFNYAEKGSSEELAVSEYLIRNNKNEDNGLYNPNGVNINASDFVMDDYKTSGEKRGKTTLLGIEFFPQAEFIPEERQAYEFSYDFNPSYNEIHKREIIKKRFSPSKRQSNSASATSEYLGNLTSYTDENGIQYSSKDAFGNTLPNNNVDALDFLSDFPYNSEETRYVVTGGPTPFQIDGQSADIYYDNNQMPSSTAPTTDIDKRTDIQRNAVRDEMGYYRNGELGNPNVDRQAWSLTSIKVPTGGVISFEYEADEIDYLNERANWTIKDDELPLVKLYNEVAKERGLRQHIHNVASDIKNIVDAATFPNKPLEQTFSMPMNTNSGGIRLKKKVLDDGVNPIVEVNYSYGTGHYTAVPADYWGNYISAFGDFIRKQRRMFQSENDLYCTEAYGQIFGTEFGGNLIPLTQNLGWTNSFDNFLAPYLRNMRLDNSVRGEHYYSKITETYADGSKHEMSYGAANPVSDDVKNTQKLIPLKNYVDNTGYGVYALVQQRLIKNAPVMREDASFYANDPLPYKTVITQYEFGILENKELSSLAYTSPTQTSHFNLKRRDDNIGNLAFTDDNGDIDEWCYGFERDGQLNLIFKLLYPHPSLDFTTETVQRQISTYLRPNTVTNNYKGVVNSVEYDYIPENGLLRSETTTGLVQSLGPLGNFTDEFKTVYKYAYESYDGINSMFSDQNILNVRSEATVNLNTLVNNQPFFATLKATANTFRFNDVTPRPLTSFTFRGDIDHESGYILNYQPYDYNGNSAPEWVNVGATIEFNDYGQPVRDRLDRLRNVSVMGYNGSVGKAVFSMPDMAYDATYSGFEDLKHDDAIIDIGDSEDNEFWYDQNARNISASNPLINAIVTGLTTQNCANEFEYSQSNVTTATYHNLLVEDATNLLVGDQITVTFNLGQSTTEVLQTSIQDVVTLSTPITIGNITYTDIICLGSPFPGNVITYQMTQWDQFLRTIASVQKNGVSVTDLLSKPSSTDAKTGDYSYNLAHKLDINDLGQRTPIRPIRIGSNPACINPSIKECAIPYKASVWVRRKDITLPPPAGGGSQDETGTVSTTMGTEDLKLVYKIWDQTYTNILDQGEFYLTNTDQNWRFYEIDIPLSKGIGEQFLEVYLENNMLRSATPFEQIYADDILIYPNGAKYAYLSTDKFNNFTYSTETNNNTASMEYDVWGRPIAVYDQNNELLSETKHFVTNNLAGEHNYVETKMFVDENNHYSESKIYADGFGKTLQTQVSEPNRNIRLVTGTMTYDNRGRAKREWMTYALPGSYFGVKENTNQSLHTQAIYGTQKAYKRFKYEDTPEQRLSEERMPREDLESTIEITTSDEANAISISTGGFGYAPNELVRQISIDDEGSEYNTYTDKEGNLVLKTSAIGYDHSVNATGAIIYNTSGTYEVAQTQYRYDRAGNLIRTTDRSGKVTEYFYNSVGELLKKVHPDEGTTDFVYDTRGKLRFSRDQKDFDEATNDNNLVDQFKFSFYDGWNRVTHAGVAKQPTGTGNSWFDLNKAVDFNFPIETENGVGYELHNEFTYDGSKDINGDGQLIEEKVYSNHSLNGSGEYVPNEEDVWTYEYNNRGELIKKACKLNEFTNFHTTTFKYNLSGGIEETLYEHPTNTDYNFMTRYEYDDLGRKVKCFSGRDANSLTEDVNLKYDAVGNLFKKSLAATSDPNNPYHEQIGYLYNVRNQPIAQLGLNFRYEIKHNEVGRLIEQKWSNNKLDNLTTGQPFESHRYDYYYDKLNRLVGADYSTDQCDDNPYTTYETVESNQNVPILNYEALGEAPNVNMKDILSDIVNVVQDPQYFQGELAFQVLNNLDSMITIVDEKIEALGTNFNSMSMDDQETFMLEVLQTLNESSIDLTHAAILYRQVKKAVKADDGSEQERIDKALRKIQRLDTQEAGLAEMSVVIENDEDLNNTGLSEAQIINEVDNNLTQQDADLDFIKLIIKKFKLKMIEKAGINPKAVAYGDAYTIEDCINPVTNTSLKYDANYRYEKNGNNEQLTRFDDLGVPTQLDYVYGNIGSNQLTSVDFTTSGSTTTYNYSYNPLGSIMDNQRSNIDEIDYEDFHRRPMEILSVSGNTSEYRYSTNLTRTVRDFGNGSKEYYLDGVILDENERPIRYTFDEGFAQLDGNDDLYKTYQIMDWLGTVRLVMADDGNILNTSDHYPYGKSMPQRLFVASTEGERYGYQGSEKEGHIDEDLYSTQYRDLDAELARWLSVDPLIDKMPWQTSYNSMDNSPVMLTDGLGSETEDDYLMNSKTGHITLLKKTDDKVDHLYLSDEEGNKTETQITFTDKAFLPMFTNKDPKASYPGTYGITEKKWEAFKLFYFAANYTEVEWKLDGYKSSKGPNKFIVASSHTPITSWGASVYGTSYYNSKRVNIPGINFKDQLFDIHSHPYSIPLNKRLYWGASGYPHVNIHDGKRYSWKEMTGDKKYRHGQQMDRKKAGGNLNVRYYVYEPGNSSFYEYGHLNSTFRNKVNWFGDLYVPY